MQLVENCNFYRIKQYDKCATSAFFAFFERFGDYIDQTNKKNVLHFLY